MDQRLRGRARAAAAGGLPELLALASARRRSGQLLARPGHVFVGGPLLGAALRHAFVACGASEVALLRAGGASERQLSKWVQSLRALMRGEPRPWPHAERWGQLLGLDREQLQSLAEFAGPPRSAGR